MNESKEFLTADWLITLLVKAKKGKKSFEEKIGILFNS